MSIDLKQTAGANVKPVDDARLFNFMLSNKVGIVEGVEITHLGANQLKVFAGWGICQGRMFTVEEEIISAETSPNGEIEGRLLINIDTSNDVPATFITQAAVSLPALVQEDINSSGTVYQIPLVEYHVNEVQCGELTDVRVMLEVTETAVRKAQQAAENAMPKSGDIFTGDVAAYSINRATGCLRNIEVRTTDANGTVQSTNKIIMVRK